MSTPEPKAPPGPLGLTGVVDAVDSQLWHFTITNVQGSYLTCYWGDVSESSVPIPTSPATVALDHRYPTAGTYHVTAHSAHGSQNDATLSVTVTESSYVPPVPDPSLGRPSVDDVALLLRARTKDSSGNEVGTFDDETRPTADAVEEHITAAMGLVGVRFPDPAKMSEEQATAFAALVAYRAACRIEKSYWPEQVQSERSPYALLWAEYLNDFDSLLESIEGGTGGGELPSYDLAEVPVGSWTSIPGSYINLPIEPVV
jgi:hypothetical protein